MSSSKTFPFSVEVADDVGETASDTRIIVLDGHDEVRVEGYGRLTAELPRGLYTVHLERAGVQREDVRHHDGATTLHLAEPRRYSSVPAADTANSHEYLVRPAMDWSVEETAPPLVRPPQAGGSLFVFIRAPSAGHPAEMLPQMGLRVLDYEGEELVELDHTTTKFDAQQGWVAFHAAVPTGEYVLAYDGSGGASAVPREMALAIFGGWQTQVFMTYTDGPSFASASVLMSRRGFSPNDRVTQAADAALGGLQNRANQIPRSQLQLLLDGKFENPMLGLIGTHVLLRTDVDPGRIQDVIIPNLRRLLGSAIDVRALELITAERFGVRVEPEPFNRPPLVRAGLEAVLRQAAGPRRELIASGSLLAALAPRRFTDSPWSSWEPIVGVPTRPSEPPEWVTTYVRDAISTAALRGASLDLTSVAERAELPLVSVASAYEHLRATMPPGDRRTAEFGRLIARARERAHDSEITPAEAKRMFVEGSAGERIEALGLMQGSERLRDFDVALLGVTAPRSAFEQFQALALAQRMVATLPADRCADLAAAIDDQRGPSGWIKPGMDRWYLSGQIIRQLKRREGELGKPPAPAPDRATNTSIRSVGLSPVSTPTGIRFFADPHPDPRQPSFQAHYTSSAEYYQSAEYMLHRHQLQPLPSPRVEPPRMDLTEVLPPAFIREIVSRTKIVFHVVSDTGTAALLQTTLETAPVPEMMVADLAGDPATAPVFCFHVGDVAYHVGGGERYYAQFYDVFRSYDRPIFAIPGNHDATVSGATAGMSPAPTLDAFIRNFCSSTPEQSPDAGGIARSTMTQPGVYFTLDAPFVSIIGLYTNVLEGPGVISSQGGQYPIGDDQLHFLSSELARLKPARELGERAVLVACHHPAVSGDSRYGGSDGLADEIDQAAHASGLWPDAVLCGHAQLYQRFTRRPVSGIEIPYIVTGSGGTSVIPPQAAMPSAPVTIGDYTLDVNPVAEPGHLTVTVDMGGVSPELTIAWTGLTTRDQVSIDLALRTTMA